MNKDIPVFGAKGVAFINYDGNIEELSKEIKKGLNTPEFWFKNDTESPFELKAYCESLGFECCLFNSTEKEGYNYCFEIETENSLTELVSNRMYDLSLWLSRNIRQLCKLDSNYNES